MVPSKEELACAFSAKKWLKLSELRIRFTATSSSSQFKRDELCSVLSALPSLRVIELDTGVGYASDDVLQDLAARCPALEIIRVRPREQPIGPIWSVSPMSFLGNYGDWRCDLTNKGLQTLLEMPQLAHIHAEALRDEDNSSLINTLRIAPPRMCRHVDLTTRYEAHKTIISFLHFLSEQDSDALQNLQLSIQLKLGNFNSSSSSPTRGIGKLLAQIQAKHAKTIKRLHLQTSKPTSYFDDETSVALYGCEVWINYVEGGRLEDCKFECIYEDGNNYF